MDTDDLTLMAYRCIVDASEATDILKSELGAACSRFKTEDDYLKGILKHVKGIEKNPKAYLNDWNLLDDTDIKIFKKRLQSIRGQIEETLKTPVEKRGNR